jgi:dihydropyrimidinase
MFDTVIHGGLLITPGKVYPADLAILDGKIAAIGDNLTGTVNIDAAGLYVLPGAVDPHVHLEMPVGQTQSSDDWKTGTIAAAYGGTTTVIDFVEPGRGQRLKDALDQRIQQARGRAAVDFGLHMTLTDDHENTLKQLPELIRAGCTSFKTYLTYEGFRLNDLELLQILEAVHRVGGLVMVHAENDAIVTYLTAKLLSEGKTTPKYHCVARPGFAEAEAVQRALTLAETANAPIYIVHISTAAGAQAVKTARAHGGQAYGETCPQYLLLTDSEYQKAGFEGAKFLCSPPLRNASDNQALWDSLTDGDLQTVGTDHCPFFFAGQKDLGIDNFSLIPGGLPGIELRLSLMHTFGVLSNHLSLERWVEVCCAAPAKIFGLFPQKGILQVGSDADLVLFDPQLEKEVSIEMLHENVDYSPYEGMKLHGAPRDVMLHGKTIVKDGRYIGTPGDGGYLSCQEHE